MNKCTLVFIAGVTISLASYAFFNQMMQMPQQAMQMMMPQPLNCECKCADAKSQIKQ